MMTLIKTASIDRPVSKSNDIPNKKILNTDAKIGSMAEQTDATTGEIYLIALILNLKAIAVPITATPSASKKLFGVSLKSITQTGCTIFMTTPAIVIPHPVTFRTSYVCSKRLGIIAHVPTAIAESRPKPNPNGDGLGIEV